MKGDARAIEMSNEALLQAVEVLTSGSEDEQAATAEQLALFTEDPRAVSARTAVNAAGALVPLIQLLSSPSPIVRLRAIQTILHLSRQKEFRCALMNLSRYVCLCVLSLSLIGYLHFLDVPKFILPFNRAEPKRSDSTDATCAGKALFHQLPSFQHTSCACVL
eukprot:869829-Prorocentrum_minimum.AAC.10